MEVNFNRHLGSKLRMRRLALGLTQTKVAQAINVTFQQIQKYEKGTNGISSLRIMQLGKILIGLKHRLQRKENGNIGLCLSNNL